MAGVNAGAARAGQAIYSPLVLNLYDLWVLGLSNHCLWRCPTAELRSLYDRNVSAMHLDVGVGTGYFLDHALWPVSDPKITLMDLNRHSLRAAARRIARYGPATVCANVLEPLPPVGPFQSVGVCYLMHCLPGTMREKGVAFDRLKPLLAPRARVFGATIVQGDAKRSLPAQKLMEFYNAKGIFSNATDTVDGLREVLDARFRHVAIRERGCVAIFEAHGAKPA